MNGRAASFSSIEIDPKRTKTELKSRSAAGSCVLLLVAAQEGSAAPTRFRTIQV